jgi:hypothetical protein
LPLPQGAREADDRRYVDAAEARFREARRLDFLCVAGNSGRRRSRKLHHLVGRVAAVDFAGQGECSQTVHSGGANSA